MNKPDSPQGSQSAAGLNALSKQILDAGYRIDMLIENQIIVELKAVERLPPVHEAQLLSYLRLADKRRGLLINFNVESLRDGIKRMVNHL